VRATLIATVLTAGLVTVLSGWLLAPASPGARPRGNYRPLQPQVHRLSGADAESRRTALVSDASPRHLAPDPIALHAVPDLPAGHPLTADIPSCRFLPESASGTSAKFDCVLEGGEVIKVKYGRNPEIHAEAAATRLLAILGYPADHVIIAPRIRCHGCPRYPFLAMRLLTLADATGVLAPYGYDRAYTDFEWVSVERRFDAPAIETAEHAGWAWWELKESHAPVAELDALRLLAVFLAHWDNKADNQRLVCLDDPVSAGGACARPVLMLQDVGATFGAAKVNLANWRGRPIWTERQACLVSMRALPSDGATFPDARISEEGRLLLARRLALLSDADIRALFADARFPEFHVGTDDARDLAAWTSAFRERAGQITNAGPCPERPSDDRMLD
jgi:hypothetical protein